MYVYPFSFFFSLVFLLHISLTMKRNAFYYKQFIAGVFYLLLSFNVFWLYIMCAFVNGMLLLFSFIFFLLLLSSFFNVFVIVVTKYLTCYSVSVFCFFLFIVCKLCLRVPLKCKSVWVGSFVVFFPFASSIRRGLFLWCYTFIVVVTTSQPHYIVFNFYLKLYSFSFLLLFFFFFAVLFT